MEFIDACRKIIAIDSTPSNGTREAAEFIAELSRSWGFDVDVQVGVHLGSEQANVIVRPKAKTAEEVLFQTHLDTSEPGNYALWTETEKNPFEAVISSQRIYGLGAAKCKIDFLCKLFALRDYASESFKKSPVLVGTFGQQLGMVGAVQVVRRQLVNAKMAVIGEPTNLSAVSSGKGIAGVELQVPFTEREKLLRIKHNESESSSSQSKMFVGKSASISNPVLGENAIIKMLDYIENLPEGLLVLDMDGGTDVHSVPAQAFLEFDIADDGDVTISKKLVQIRDALKDLEREFHQHQDAEFHPPYSTLSIGRIRTYEDYVSISGSCRLIPVDDSAIYDGWMDRLRDVCQSVQGAFRMSEFKRPFRTDPSSGLIQQAQSVLRDMGLSEELGKQAKSTEASVFGRMGIDCLIFGPGEISGNARTPNESASLEDLSKATEFYKQMIKRLCQ